MQHYAIIYMKTYLTPQGQSLGCAKKKKKSKYLTSFHTNLIQSQLNSISYPSLHLAIKVCSVEGAQLHLVLKHFLLQ